MKDINGIKFHFVLCINQHFVFLFFSLVSELIDGTPTLKINHGSGTVVLQLPSNVNVADRRWHRLDIRSNSKVSKLWSVLKLQVVSHWANKTHHLWLWIHGGHLQ